ncbi:hypothetical protein AciX8_1814 [Granulicella mallensis MP5ACTX8]|uniref:Uncharacterized protein n=1 Tax=Granulicella mallensis (strain ATCC BAA-1857 / DSM 23137 / MP5ACTX8) TaxID=682795 RepID=G8NR73_GRAMM|nr:hypothetical protein AciX8_1814 [Granulicella mallensis MP5ACTX8]
MHLLQNNYGWNLVQALYFRTCGSKPRCMLIAMKSPHMGYLAIATIKEFNDES